MEEIKILKAGIRYIFNEVIGTICLLVGYVTLDRKEIEITLEEIQSSKDELNHLWKKYRGV